MRLSVLKILFYISPKWGFCNPNFAFLDEKNFFRQEENFPTAQNLGGAPKFPLNFGLGLLILRLSVGRPHCASRPSVGTV